MNILVACEESQRTTIELRKLGHNAFSCDIQDCSGGHSEWHIKNDAISVAYNKKYKWDMMIAHPPCTYLSNAGNRWFNVNKYGDKARLRIMLREQAYQFFVKLYNAPIKKIAIENPLGYMNNNFKKPNQIIQPFQFGEPCKKTTCLWLKNLPKLKPTNIVKPKAYGVYKSGPKKGKDIQWCDMQTSAKARSKTFKGIAKAFAQQWAGKNK